MINKVRLPSVAYFLFILISLVWISYIGSGLILPLIFALLLSAFILPIVRRYERLLNIKWLSIILGFLTIIVPAILILAVIAYQLKNIIENLPSIKTSIEDGFTAILNKFNHIFPGLREMVQSFIDENLISSLEGPLSAVGSGLLSSTSIIVNGGLAVLYAFFILYYRKSIQSFIVFQFTKRVRSDVSETLNEIKDTIQSYIGGLGLVILVLTTLNTIGLYVIGIKYALFWGALAGLMAIVPYIGTILGGFLPFLFALATADAGWQPVAIVVYYTFIQQLEGNVITPVLVGDQVNINPLFALLALVFFGTLWGIGGVVLALPMISILRIILLKFENTEPLGILMSSELGENTNHFELWAKNRA